MWPESIFQTPTPLLFQNFWFRLQLFFKFENPIPVQNPATIIDPTIFYSCFCLRNDCTDSCYSRDGKVTPVPGPVFTNFCLRIRIRKENAESCRNRLPFRGGRSHFFRLLLRFSFKTFETGPGSETHFCFPESFQFPLGNLILLTPNTICETYKLPFFFRIELVQRYYYICDH